LLNQNSKKSGNKFKISNSPLVIVVSAPSGAGKTTVVSQLLRSDHRLLKTVSHTTRKPRPGEVNEKDYFFCTHEAFDRMVEATQFIEWANVYGEKYGTSMKTIDDILRQKKSAILVIEEQGAQNIKNLFPDNSVFVLLLPPSMEELEKRIKNRPGMTGEETVRRLDLAWQEIESMQWYDYVFVNENVNETAEQVVRMVESEQHKLSRCVSFS